MVDQPVLEEMAADGHETVVFGRDSSSGLQAIIAIHSTVLGPALGGTRLYPYTSEAEALHDVLRLSEGMTFKAAAAGLDLGGGKAVLIGDLEHKTPEMLHSFGRLVERLGGSYITAEDVGTTVSDLVEVSSTTRWVTGLPFDMGGSGDPSPATARGVVGAMRAAGQQLWSSADLADRTIAIQGVGKVGSHLARLLAEEGATVLVSDIDRPCAEEVAESIGAEPCPPDEILTRPCDVLAPCALGGVLDQATIPRLRCAAVVGSANNQLADPACAERLAERDILYVPDYLANAGGIINISAELDPGGYDADRALDMVDDIEDRVGQILAQAVASGTSPAEAAAALARRRLEKSARNAGVAV